MRHLLLSTCTYLSLFVAITHISTQTLSALPDPQSTSDITMMTGTYLKLNITPDKDADNPTEQAKLCAEYFKARFAHTSHNLIINYFKSSLEIYAATTNPNEIEEISKILTYRARLSIHKVHRKSHTLADKVAAKEQEIQDHIALPHHYTNSNTNETTTTQILIRKKAELTEKDVKIAYIDPQDFSIIQIELTDAGGQKMKDFTLSLTSRVDMIATVMNEQVLNYATLNADQLGKRFVITGINSIEEGRQIVAALQSPLQSTLKITEQHTFETQLRPQP